MINNKFVIFETQMNFLNWLIIVFIHYSFSGNNFVDPDPSILFSRCQNRSLHVLCAKEASLNEFPSQPSWQNGHLYGQLLQEARSEKKTGPNQTVSIIYVSCHLGHQDSSNLRILTTLVWSFWNSDIFEISQFWSF